MKIEAYGRTDCGPVRDNNEDDLMLDTQAGIIVVADGMGGHAAGEVASQEAVRMVHEVLVGSRDPDETRLMAPSDALDPDSVMAERLRYAMNQASVHIRTLSEQRPATRGMGTTVVVLAVDGDRAHVAHVGDSRAYLFRDGALQRITKDHTVVQQEIDAGRLTPELARLLPHRNILTQSVGFHGPVEPGIASMELRDGDLYLLCSDGLTDALDDRALSELLGSAPADMLPDTLVDAALAAGAEDNVTVAVVAVLG